MSRIITCASCQAAALLRARWFVTGAGWTEQDLCGQHSEQVKEMLAGPVAALLVPPYTLGPPGVQIARQTSPTDRAANRDDRAALEGLF